MIESHGDVVVCQRGMDLETDVNRLAKLFPRVEMYRLTCQGVKAAELVATNIAARHSRRTRKDYANFITIARGSRAETATFRLFAQRVDFFPVEQTTKAWHFLPD